MIHKDDFIHAINTKGYCVVEDVVSQDFVTRMGEELMQAVEKESQNHSPENSKDYGRVLMCPIYGGTFLDIYDKEKFIQPFEWILDEQCITYTLTSSCIPPQDKIYTCRIHVDYPRIIPNYHTILAGQLLLDDFTVENGATWLLPNSQHTEEMPDEDFFYANAERLVAKKGSCCYFNPRLWHAGAPNLTDKWRRCLLLGMIRPWMKQRFDIPRMLTQNDTDLTSLSEKALQKLGFFSQPPASYEEYYQPLQKRKFRQVVV